MGRRAWSHGPASSLRSCACRDQPVPAVAPLPVGPACTVPCSRVVGAWGHRAARLTARSVAWANCKGCEDQGASVACRSACMGSAAGGGGAGSGGGGGGGGGLGGGGGGGARGGCVGSAWAAVGLMRACSCSCAAAVASVPFRVACAPTCRAVVPPGTAALTVPSTVAF